MLGRLLGGAVLGLGLLAVPAAAVEPTVVLTLEEVDAPITPEIGVALSRVRASVTCTGEENTQTPVRFQLGVAAVPAYGFGFVDPADQARFVTPGQCFVTPTIFNATFTASVTMEAPAFSSAEYQIHAFVENGYPTPSRYGPYAAGVNITNGFAPRTAAIPGEQRLNARPGGTVQFPVDVANHANGPVNVSFAQSESPVAVEFPSTLYLESQTTQGTDAAFRSRVTLNATAPRSAAKNDALDFQVLVTTRYAGPEGASLPPDLTILPLSIFINRSAIPAAPLGALLLALAALALLRRR